MYEIPAYAHDPHVALETWMAAEVLRHLNQCYATDPFYCIEAVLGGIHRGEIGQRGSGVGAC